MKMMKELGMMAVGSSTIIYFKKYFADTRIVKYDKRETMDALLDTASDLIRMGEMNVSTIQLHGQDENDDIDQVYLDINKPMHEVVKSFLMISDMNDKETYSITFSL